jgi:aspartyl/asparaginyl-tRNA synthetase
LRLRARYGSIEQLQQKIKAKGVSPDDHSLYTDLLEWQAIQHELTGLVNLLETM